MGPELEPGVATKMSKLGPDFGTCSRGPTPALSGQRSEFEAESRVFRRTQVRSGHGHDKVRGDSRASSSMVPELLCG